MIFPIEVSGKEIMAVFSGDTIVDQRELGHDGLGTFRRAIGISL